MSSPHVWGTYVPHPARARFPRSPKFKAYLPALSREVRWPVLVTADGLTTACLKILVYARCMSRTNMDIDDEACAAVMRRYCLTTKREAVNFALRAVASEPLGIDEARQLRGSGWDGDLEEMRISRST